MIEWISIKEKDRKPELKSSFDNSMKESDEVLFYVPGWPHGFPVHAGVLIDDDGLLKWNSQDNWFKFEEITHWAEINMPKAV